MKAVEASREQVVRKRECPVCRESHNKQVFISHSRSDKELAESIASACCTGSAFPYLFEFELEKHSAALGSAVFSDEIATEIRNSCLHLVLLGPGLSSKFWTQAWIGYEVGIRRGLDLATKMLNECGEYFACRVLVVKDVKQDVEVCVPYLHALLLLDFAERMRWQQLGDFVRFFADTLPGKPEETLSDFFATGHRVESRLLRTNGRIKCSNSKCGSTYELWLFKDDLCKLPGAVWSGDNGICQVKCPSCPDKIEFSLRANW
jgi:hypothetical protein